MKASYWVMLLPLLIVQSACNDLLTEVPRDTLMIDNFYRTADDATAAIAATYRPLSTPNLFGTHLKSALISASDYATVGPDEENAQIVALTRLTWDARTPRVTLPWQGFYSIATRANVVLEQLPGVEMAAGPKAQIAGEAKFLRALAYFYLVRLYGDVPLVTTTEQQLGEPSRSPQQEVLARIVEDAQDAAAVLPLSWNNSNKGRAPQAAALALLAEISLWREDWQRAADYAKQIIDSDVFALEPDYIEAFLPGSEMRREEIFAAQASAQTGAPIIRTASMFYPRELIPTQAGGFASMVPLEWHLESYPEGDQRKEVGYFTSGTRVDGVEVTFSPHVYKYRPTARPGPEDANWPIYRYGEVLLFYAEALNELGNTAEAVSFLDLIRARAQVAAYSGPFSQAEVRDTIFEERRLELAFEGKRWFDLVRRGPDFFLAMQAKGVATNAEATDMLWPIPQSELDVNPNLTQNPGY